MELKSAKLLHNPQAGEGELTGDDLVALIREEGFECSYSSTKETGWDKLKEKETDFVVLAGGDGTVRKVAEELLDKKVIDKKFPIALLPLGTANNIARTLGIEGTIGSVIRRWHQGNIKKYDIGKIRHLKKARFFLESIGFGLFPQLMKNHSRDRDGNERPEDSIKSALETLLDTISHQKPQHAVVKANGKTWEDEFLLVEVMNTSSIGPTLQLAPLADPGDGLFDIVMITNDQRQDLVHYVKGKLNGQEVHNFETIRASGVELHWEGTYLHVDDELIKMDEPKVIDIELVAGVLEFIL